MWTLSLQSRAFRLPNMPPLGSAHQKKVFFTFGLKALNLEQCAGGSRDPGDDKHLGTGCCTRLASAPPRLLHQPGRGPQSAFWAGRWPGFFQTGLELSKLPESELLRSAILTCPPAVKGGLSTLTLNPGWANVPWGLSSLP